MSDLRRRFCEQLGLKLSAWRYRMEMRCGRIVRAWRYCIGRLTADDAQTSMLDCRHSAGWYPLLVLTVDDALEQPHEALLDHPHLPRLIPHAGPPLADNWQS